MAVCSGKASRGRRRRERGARRWGHEPGTRSCCALSWRAEGPAGESTTVNHTQCAPRTHTRSPQPRCPCQRVRVAASRQGCALRTALEPRGAGRRAQSTGQHAGRSAPVPPSLARSPLHSCRAKPCQTACPRPFSPARNENWDREGKGLAEDCRGATCLAEGRSGGLCGSGE